MKDFDERQPTFYWGNRFHTHTEIALLRHCGASLAIQLEAAMEVRMRMLRADNKAWKMLKWVS